MANRALRAPRYSAPAAACRCPGAPGTAAALGLHPDLRQQAGQQGDVHRGPFGRRGTDRHPEIAGQPLQLALEVLPLADAQVVQELGAAHAAERRAGQLALPLGQVLPQVQEGEEVRVRLGEAAVAGVGGLLLASAGRSRGSWMDSAAAMISTSRTQPLLLGLQDHPAERGSDRQPGQLAPDAGECWPPGERAQLLEQPERRRRCCGRRAGRRTGSRRRRRGRARPSAG